MMSDAGNELRDFLWALRRALYVILHYIENRYGPGHG